MNVRQVVGGMILVLAGGLATAGSYAPAPLTIDFDNHIATGDMYSARLSGNPDAFIGCGVRAVAGYTYGFCQAQSGPTEEYLAQCFAEDPGMVAAIGALDDFSYITFAWDGDGNCTFVGNSTQSFYLPEFPKTDKVDKK
jgi:hypothetical protein